MSDGAYHRMRYMPSPSDLAELRRLWGDPTVPIETIRKRLRTSSAALHALARCEGLPARPRVKTAPTISTKPLPPTAKQRRCLVCRDDFLSEHIGHRVCNDCKATEAWRSGQGVMCCHDLRDRRVGMRGAP